MAKIGGLGMGRGLDALMGSSANANLTTNKETENTKSLSEVKLKSTDKVAVIVGSEGGFSEEECNKLINEGVNSVSLGKRILRCETAPMYVLSAISYEFEL